jgi:hypothetical protein
LSPPWPGAASENVPTPPPTNTSPLPALLLDALLLDALLLDALPLDALLLVPPVEALLELVASPPAPVPLDEPVVVSVFELHAADHSPASATRAPSAAAGRADARGLPS